MIESIVNIFRVPELKKRVLFTLMVLAVYTMCRMIPLPGVDQTKVLPENQILGWASLLSGGAFERCAIIALGIMPYISASIILQLLSSTVPALERLAKEGETGRRKINEYTRYLTVPLCLVQAAMYINWMIQYGVLQRGIGNWIMGLTVLTAGTVFLMWMGEQIDEYGIGNGASILITAGIVDRVPGAIIYIIGAFRPTLSLGGAEDQITLGKVLVLALGFVAVVFGVILIYQAQRRIPLQQAKHMRGRRVYGGQRHYLPLRVNQAGVMPVIFASSLLIFPSGLFQWMHSTIKSDAARLLNGMFQGGAFVYTVLYIALIFFFGFFWTAIQFNPKEMANNLRDYGSSVPGLRPGRRTADYLERVMIRITLAGAAFLSAIAVLPQVVAESLKVRWDVASFFGGTSLLIVVSVMLDVVQKVESHLLMRHYEGFMRSRRR